MWEGLWVIKINKNVGCLIVCDIKDPNSLEETLKWKSIIEENSD